MKTTNNGFYKYSKVLTSEEMDEMKQMTVLNEQVSLLSSVNRTTEEELDGLADSIIESMKQDY